MKGRVVSVFDLDHTLLSVNSSHRFGAFLYRREVFSFFQMVILLSWYCRHKFLGMAISRLHSEIFYRIFWGRPLAFFQGQVTDYLDAALDEVIYHPGYQRLVEAQQRNHETVILSSAPDFLVEGVAERFGVDDWRATVYEIDGGGRFSCISRVMDGDDKAQYLSEHIKPFCDRVYAYTDSILDLPFLEAATVPVAVNPDKKLRAVCKRRDWEIVE